MPRLTAWIPRYRVDGQWYRWVLVVYRSGWDTRTLVGIIEFISAFCTQKQCCCALALSRSHALSCWSHLVKLSLPNWINEFWSAIWPRIWLQLSSHTCPRCEALHRLQSISKLNAVYWYGFSEMRRLSPVAVMANVSGGNYLDLINGPQDHGWCDGYTCQERLSTFHAIVADGKAPFTRNECESDFFLSFCCS